MPTSGPVQELVKSIAEWIAANADCESIFLTANPQWEVNATALLDHICSATGISREQIDKWIEEGKGGKNANK